MTTAENPRAVIGNNLPPDPIDEALTAIADLYDEAKNFADGEAIGSQEMHDEITKLYDAIHEAGKRADELRKEEKRPLDEQIDAIQSRFNPFIQPKKGKVDQAKSALGDLLAAWRKRVADAKAEEARLAREEADRIAAEAQAAIRLSAGNLAEREKAEELLAHAKQVDRFAKRQDKAATTGTGLRSNWVADPVDWDAGLEWAYTRDEQAFRDLVQTMASTAARNGLRDIPGFKVWNDQRAN